MIFLSSDHLIGKKSNLNYLIKKNVNFKELDFQTSIEENEKIILKALGIPPIMMDSGNNANIRPNMRMYYLETILPIEPQKSDKNTVIKSPTSTIGDDFAVDW